MAVNGANIFDIVIFKGNMTHEQVTQQAAALYKTVSQRLPQQRQMPAEPIQATLETQIALAQSQLSEVLAIEPTFFPIDISLSFKTMSIRGPSSPI